MCAAFRCLSTSLNLRCLARKLRQIENEMDQRFVTPNLPRIRRSLAHPSIHLQTQYTNKNKIPNWHNIQTKTKFQMHPIKFKCHVWPHGMYNLRLFLLSVCLVIDCDSNQSAASSDALLRYYLVAHAIIMA